MQTTKKSFNHMLQNNHGAQISKNVEEFWNTEFIMLTKHQF